jgi:hypothetical protein
LSLVVIRTSYGVAPRARGRVVVVISGRYPEGGFQDHEPSATLTDCFQKVSFWLSSLKPRTSTRN